MNSLNKILEEIEKNPYKLKDYEEIIYKNANKDFAKKLTKILILHYIFGKIGNEFIDRLEKIKEIFEKYLSDEEFKEIIVNSLKEAIREKHKITNQGIELILDLDKGDFEKLKESKKEIIKETIINYLINLKNISPYRVNSIVNLFSFDEWLGIVPKIKNKTVKSLIALVCYDKSKRREFTNHIKSEFSSDFISKLIDLWAYLSENGRKTIVEYITKFKDKLIENLALLERIVYIDEIYETLREDLILTVEKLLDNEQYLKDSESLSIILRITERILYNLHPMHKNLTEEDKKLREEFVKHLVLTFYKVLEKYPTNKVYFYGLLYLNRKFCREVVLIPIQNNQVDKLKLLINNIDFPIACPIDVEKVVFQFVEEHKNLSLLLLLTNSYLDVDSLKEIIMSNFEKNPLLCIRYLLKNEVIIKNKIKEITQELKEKHLSTILELFNESKKNIESFIELARFFVYFIDSETLSKTIIGFSKQEKFIRYIDFLEYVLSKMPRGKSRLVCYNIVVQFVRKIIELRDSGRFEREVIENYIELINFYFRVYGYNRIIGEIFCEIIDRTVGVHIETEFPLIIETLRNVLQRLPDYTQFELARRMKRELEFIPIKARELVVKLQDKGILTGTERDILHNMRGIPWEKIKDIFEKAKEKCKTEEDLVELNYCKMLYKYMCSGFDKKSYLAFLLEQEYYKYKRLEMTTRYPELKIEYRKKAEEFKKKFRDYLLGKLKYSEELFNKLNRNFITYNLRDLVKAKIRKELSLVNIHLICNQLAEEMIKLSMKESKDIVENLGNITAILYVSGAISEIEYKHLVKLLKERKLIEYQNYLNNISKRELAFYTKVSKIIGISRGYSTLKPLYLLLDRTYSAIKEFLNEVIKYKKVQLPKYSKFGIYYRELSLELKTLLQNVSDYYKFSFDISGKEIDLVIGPDIIGKIVDEKIVPLSYEEYIRVKEKLSRLLKGESLFEVFKEDIERELKKNLVIKVIEINEKISEEIEKNAKIALEGLVELDKKYPKRKLQELIS